MDGSSAGWAWPVGAALALFAPLLLARAWGRGREGRAARIAGWSALGAAMLLLTAATSVGRGVAFALVLLPFPALMLIGTRPDRREVQPRPRESNATLVQPWRGRALRTVLRTSTALLAVVAALLVTTVIARMLFDPVVGVVASMALVVCLAAGGIGWAIADRRWWRPAVALAGVALFALIALRA